MENRKKIWNRKQKIASLILLERVYIIIFAFYYPLVVLILAGVNIFFGYSIFLVLGTFLIYYFVISNKLMDKSKRYFQFTFPISTCVFLTIILNQLFGFISILIISSNLNPFNIIFFVVTVIFIFMGLINSQNPLMLRINQYYLTKVRGKNDKTHIKINISFIILFSSLFLLNYIIPVYNFSYQARERDDFQIGFWTYGTPLDNQSYEVTGGDNISNETLKFMGDHEVYIIFGITNDIFEDEDYLEGNLNFTERLKRCKDHGVKVHLCVNHRYWEKPYVFANIWTIEDTIEDLYRFKELLQYHDLWGDPVDTLVFDIEPVIPYYTSFYGLTNPELGNPISNMEKLREYDEIFGEYVDFINKVEKSWELNVELCHIGMNLYDRVDGDDDLLRIWGLIDAETSKNIQRSYMIYRGDILSQKFLIDSMDMMSDNDIVIISGFDKGAFYYDDVDLAVNDGLLVKNYPKKDLHLQVWELYRFIDAYGEEAIIELIKGVEKQEEAYYSMSSIYSLVNDVLFFFYIYIDIYFSGLLFIFKIP